MIDTYTNNSLENAQAELDAAKQEEGRLQREREIIAADIHHLEQLKENCSDRIYVAHANVIAAERRVRKAKP